MILKKAAKVLRCNQAREADNGTEGTVVEVMPIGGDRSILAGAILREMGSKIPADHKVEAVYLVKWHDLSWFPEPVIDYYIKEQVKESQA